MDTETRDQVADLPFVRWVGHYDPAYRLAPNLLQEAKELEQLRGKPPAVSKDRPKKKTLM